MVVRNAVEPCKIQGKTGRFIDSVVQQLIVSIKDSPTSNTSEIEAIKRALSDIGHQHPTLTISSVLNFLTSNEVGLTHRVALLEIVSAVVENASLERSLADQVANVAVHDVTATKDIIPQWQAAASAVIAAVCKRSPKAAHSAIVSSWPSGTIPHYFLLRCVAEFAQFNPTFLVPNLAEISTRLVNSIGLVKNINVKWSFANAVGCICEAIQHVAADETTSTSLRTSFSSELAPVFDTLLSWVAGKEIKVKLQVIESIGLLTVVTPPEFLRPRIPKIVTTLFTLLKKEKQLEAKLPILKSLSSLLTAISASSLELESSQLDEIFKTILNLGTSVQQQLSDVPSAEALRMWSECIRSVDALFLGRHTNAATIDFFFNSITSPSSPNHLGTSLLVVKQLLATHPVKFEDRRDNLVAMCRGATSSTSVVVRKALVEMTATLARQGLMNISGADDLIHFVVSCAGTTEETPAEKNLTRISEDVLNLIVTTIPEIHNILWPSLIEQMKPEAHFAAAPIISKCLAILIENLPEELRVPLSLEEYRDVPKADWMISMMFIFLHKPKSSTAAVSLLSWLGCIPEVYGLEEEPGKVLKEGSESLTKVDPSSSNYEPNLLLMFARFCAAISEKFLEDLSLRFQSVINTMTESEQKRAILRYIGTIASVCKRKDLVVSLIGWLLSHCCFNDEKQRQGLASACGLVAEHHLDPVLDALGQSISAGNNQAAQQSSGFFKKKKSGPKIADDLVSTIILCLGHVCKHAPVNLLAPRLETYVLPYIKPYLVKGKISSPVREAALSCVYLMAKALHPSKLADCGSSNVARFVFKPRDELLELVLELTNPADVPESAISPIRFKALSALSSLVVLPPGLTSTISTNSLNAVLRLTASSTDQKKELEERLERAMVAILDSNPTLERLLSICDSVGQWLEGSPDSTASALACQRAALQRFIELISQPEYERNLDDVFPIGNLLGPLIPCSFHQYSPVRLNALDCVELALFAHHIYSNPVSDSPLVPPESLTKFSSTKSSINDEVHTAGASALGAATAGLLTSLQVLELSNVLGRVVLTCNPSTASYCGSFLSSLIKAKGSELESQVVGILSSLLSFMSMSGVSEGSTVNDGSIAGALLDPLLILSDEHHTTALDYLLSSFDTKNPDEKSMSTATAALLRGMIARSDGAKVFWRIIEALNSGQQFESPRGGTIQPSGITCGLTLTLTECLASKAANQVIEESKSNDDDEDEPVGLWAATICTIMLRIGCCKDLTQFDAHSQVIKCLQHFLALKNNVSLSQSVNSNGTFNLLGTGHSIPHGITNLAFSIVKARPEMLVSVHKFLSKFFSASYSGQRLVATSVSSEFIRHFSKPSKFMMSLINSILSRTTDEESSVRLMAIKGLGNVAISGKRQINKYSGTVLNCLLPSMADQSNDVSIEALNALKHVVELADVDKVDSMVVTITLHLRPLLARPVSALRVACFDLLAALANVRTEASIDGLTEQAHHFLPSFLIFAYDECEEVRSHTMKAFEALARYTECSALNELISSRSVIGGYSEYMTFLRNMAEVLQANFLSHLNSYIMACLQSTKSDIDFVRANSALVSASLVCGLSEASRKRLSLEHCPMEILSMLKDPSSYVRTNAALSLALFKDL
ncbi:hypothetical protein P9112_011261 [Eukaryota sp. TZLM1-RC]